MGKHAYLILAHKNQEQLRKLVELLDDERNDIFIHIDRKSSMDQDFIRLGAKKSQVRFVDKALRVNWGGVSIMRAEIKLLKLATETGIYDYYHLLSGQDLPIKSPREILAFFDENTGKEFINFWELQKGNLSRFQYYTVFPEGERPFYTRLVNHFFKGLQMALGVRINKGVEFRMSSQWFSITDALARYVVAHEDWLEKVFRHTSTCDEIFLATLVWNSPFRDKVYMQEAVETNKTINQSNMRYIDWSRGESIRHPWTFREDDFPVLMEVPHFWARKFDADVDNRIIDLIYSHLKESSGNAREAQ